MSYRKTIKQLYGVGLTDDGKIALELGAFKADLRLSVLVEPRKNTIIHSCPAVKQGRPCWHLAAGLDAAYYVAGKKLQLPQKGPVAEIVSVDEQPPRVTVVRDLTPGYLESRGCSRRDGDFKIFKFSPDTDVVPSVSGPRFAFGRFRRAVLALLRAVQA